ncbi:MAG TPA: NADH-quinone oxidoreductase subunit J, partial [Kofleriaceae bacterium]|nr:NADH-quinone oxidoreductase subunit J [Kofleriaceae bacterium]
MADARLPHQVPLGVRGQDRHLEEGEGRMIRTLILVALVASAAVVGTRPAAAADPPAQAVCTPPIEAGLRAALPGSRTVACRPHKTPVQVIDGKTFAGTVDAISADVVLADGRRATVDLSPTGQVLGMAYAHSDLVSSSGKGMALLFWAFALIAVAGAVFVITRRNLIAAVMGMVGSFFGIAAVYMLLYAQFLAVVQLLVYAGAIMVLFVFVIMLLNAGVEDQTKGSRVAFLFGIPGMLLGSLLVGWVVRRHSGGGSVGIGALPGAPKVIGDLLFHEFLLPF